MNRKSFRLACFIVLTASAGHVPAAEEWKPRKSFDELVNAPVVYSLPGMDKVTVRADIKYTQVDNPHLLMDVYIPPRLKKAETRPAVLFIHGGAGAESAPKNWGIYKTWGRLMGAAGIVGVTFTHRLNYPDPLLAESESDVNAAIDYVRTNAGSLNIDKDRICLAAYSAGGPMLSMAMRDKPEYVRCLVAFYAFMDVQQSDLHRTHEKPEAVKAFSPITHLAKDAGKIAPMFIARAGLDEIPTMNDSIDRFMREAISRNARVSFVNHPEGFHGFDNQNDDERSREIIRNMLAFVRFHLEMAE